MITALLLSLGVSALVGVCVVEPALCVGFTDALLSILGLYPYG